MSPSKPLVPAIGPCSVTAFQPSCQIRRLPNISYWVDFRVGAPASSKEYTIETPESGVCS